MGGMKDVHLKDLAGRQYNRFSRSQALALRYSPKAIDYRLRTGLLVAVEEGVYAFPPVLDDDRGKWTGATLTAPDSFLSDTSAAAAFGFWSRPRDFEIVTRPGSGGPRRHGDVLVRRSILLEGETTMLGPIPITRPARTLLDLAASVPRHELARALREAVRLEVVTLDEIAEAIGRHPGRRGNARLGRVIARYAGIPLERARSGAEVKAMTLLRDAGIPLPRLNQRIAGEEADLSWARRRLIIEIDGKPFHLDVGEDARKQQVWEAAGWRVERIASEDVYERPFLLLDLAAPPRAAERP